MDKKPTIILLGVGVIILLILGIWLNFSNKTLKFGPVAIPEDIKQNPYQIKKSMNIFCYL